MNKHNFSRRDLLKFSAAGAAISSLSACATMDSKPLGRVVVVGGGYGGATAAKYIRIWSEGKIEVTLVEPNENFISCPMSNLVIGGSKAIADITVPYSGLAKYGVKVARDSVTGVDADQKTVRLASGATLEYDRLVLSPNGSLGDADSARQESFVDGLLDCPHYTRPETYEGIPVPAVLMSGDHAAISRWRLKQSLGRTWQRRPDLIERRRLNESETRLLDEYRREHAGVDVKVPRERVG